MICGMKRKASKRKSYVPLLLRLRALMHAVDDMFVEDRQERMFWIAAEGQFVAFGFLLRYHP